MRLEKKISWFLAALLVVSLVLLIVQRSDATERPPNIDVRQSNDMNNQTSGDIGMNVDATMTGGSVVGGDTSFAMDSKSVVVAAPGLGDVDIAACLGSTQWSLLVGGKQKLVLNQVCMAEFYLKQGRYDLAAQSLCNQPEIVAEYETESQCEAAHDFTPAMVAVEPTAVYEPVAAHEEDIQVVQMAQTDLYERVNRLEQQAPPEPVIVQQQAEPLLTEQDKLDVMGLLLDYGEDEDDE